MSISLLFLVSVLLGASATTPSTTSAMFPFPPHCTSNTYCVSDCNVTGVYNTDTTLMLYGLSEGHRQFITSFESAISIINKYPGVNSEDKIDLHMTLQYFCCYNAFTYAKIAEVLATIKWRPIPLTFSKVVCNWEDGKRAVASLVILLSPESESLLQDYVARIETELVQRGIPVRKPRSRMEPFHSTLAVVHPTYPIRQVLEELQAQISTPLLFFLYKHLISTWN